MTNNCGAVAYGPDGETLECNRSDQHAHPHRTILTKTAGGITIIAYWDR